MRLPVIARGLNQLGAPARFVGLIVAVGLFGGCDVMSFKSFDPNKGFLDPSEIAVLNPKRGPLLVPILEKVAPDYEETDEVFTQATDVRPEDLVVPSGDVLIGVSDTLSISISDLVSPGVETVKQTRVSETGKISLPLIGQIQAEGLTEPQLEQAIVAAYRDQQIIQQAQVSVQIIVAQSRTFSILGSVQQPGEFAIPRNDFRLLEALVSARGLTVETDVRGTRGIEDIFILRREHEEAGPSTKPASTMPADLAPSDVLNPSRSPTTQPAGSKQMMLLQATGAAANEPATTPAAPAPGTGSAGENEGRYIIGPDGKPQYVGPRESNPAPPGPAPTNPEVSSTPPARPGATTQGFGFSDLKPPLDTRIIRVPVAALQEGDLRYNIVIHPDDIIIVRPPESGEYYMGGHVGRVGVYSLSARKITLTQAVISAGMLDQLAVPTRCQIIRRIGADHQLFARVDLEKIFAGEQPDIFLKPEDQVLVGTNALAPFLAAARGSFRVTYGFGFLYDRNYAYRSNLQTR